MKIALCQTRSTAGDLLTNVVAHCRFAKNAATADANVVVFPELSLTGYEPKLAGQLATAPADSRLTPLRQICDSLRITVVAGLPTGSEAGVRISAVIFEPLRAVRVYSKMHLHRDEAPYFAPGDEYTGLIGSECDIGLAICYELSMPEHLARVRDAGAKIYLASVAKSQAGVESAMLRLADVARQHRMPCGMVNGVGPADDFVCAGQTSAWDSNGRLLARLDEAQEGILLYDTIRNEATALAFDSGSEGSV